MNPATAGSFQTQMKAQECLPRRAFSSLPTSPLLPLMWVTPVPPDCSRPGLQGTAWSAPCLDRRVQPCASPSPHAVHHRLPGLFRPSHLLGSFLLQGLHTHAPASAWKALPFSRYLVQLTHSTSTRSTSHFLQKLSLTPFADKVTFLWSKMLKALNTLPFLYLWSLTFWFCFCWICIPTRIQFLGGLEQHVPFCNQSVSRT